MRGPHRRSVVRFAGRPWGKGRLSPENARTGFLFCYPGCYPCGVVIKKAPRTRHKLTKSHDDQSRTPGRHSATLCDTFPPVKPENTGQLCASDGLCATTKDSRFCYPTVTPETQDVASQDGLTALKIDRLKADPNRRQEIPDGRQAGLFLVLQPSGKKTFAVRYRFNGKPAKLTLQPGLSLADARKLAADAMYEIAKGNDPRRTKKLAKQKAASDAANTLQSICERYMLREGGKLRSASIRESALRRLVYPVLGDRAIDTIKRTEITQLLDKVEDQTGSRAADLVLAYLRKIFNWYAIQSDEFLSPIVKGMSRYDYAGKRRKRFLKDAEIKMLWQATEDGGPIASILRFLLLTGCRRSEGARLRWDELNGREWLLPAARHKNKHTDLLRPLSDAALAIVQAQPRIDNSLFVFSNDGVRPIAFGSRSRGFMKAIGITENWTVHDLRRTSRTLLSRAGVDSDIAEKCLGHLPGTIRAVYDQHKYQTELRHAFEQLSTLIERIVNPPPANVTPMRRGVKR